MKESFRTEMEPKECMAYHINFLLLDLVPSQSLGYIEDLDFENVVIDWDVEIECKKYGITGHTKTVTAISGTMNTRYYKTDQLEEDEPLELIGSFSFFVNEKYEDCVKYKSEKGEVILSLELNFIFNNDSLVPEEVEVDFLTKKFIIS